MVTHWVPESKDIPPVGMSEICRHLCIFYAGGIYLDCDIELLKDPSPLLGVGTFFGVEEPPRLVNAALSGGPEGNLFNYNMIFRIIKAYRQGKNPAQAGPQLLTRMVRGRKDITLIPKKVWAPWNWNEKACDPGEAICVHHWFKNW